MLRGRGERGVDKRGKAGGDYVCHEQFVGLSTHLGNPFDQIGWIKEVNRAHVEKPIHQRECHGAYILQ